MPSNDIVERALVASVYRVTLCLSVRVAEQKVLFASCVSSLGLVLNSSIVCWALGWILVTAILVLFFAWFLLPCATDAGSWMLHLAF